MPKWLEVQEGDAPVIVSMPHTGIDLLPEMEWHLFSSALARRDTDWHVEKLYDFVPSLGITTFRTTMSRTVIDVNRDPSGKSLYPGQATTELCPTTTFDGDPLYRPGNNPETREIGWRRAAFFDPYHKRLAAELMRLRSQHPKVVLFDAHSIRSIIPRLFEGDLPDFNIGTNSGASCDAALTAAIEETCNPSGFSHVTNGRFKGGWTTRHYGKPQSGFHAVQLELACRTYMADPPSVPWDRWPSPYDEQRAAPVKEVLRRIIDICLEFASTP